jgi:hypothetical protein
MKSILMQCIIIKVLNQMEVNLDCRTLKRSKIKLKNNRRKIIMISNNNTYMNRRAIFKVLIKMTRRILMRMAEFREDR